MADVVRETRRWYWQRVSAVVLALCVLVHLATIIYAVRSGLSAETILARTRGSVTFAAFYTIFVAACAVHVPIGIARVAEEWLGLTPRTADGIAHALALLLFVLGMSAVYAMVAG